MKLRSLKRNLLLLLASILFSALLMELSIYLLATHGFFNIDKPAYSFDSVKNRFWVDENKDFGVWHQPFSKYHHRKSCFDVTYQANSYGARDKERQKESKNPRVVVLGDSFIEGYCVGDNRRLTDLLEKDSATEYLNFGTAGHFGTTQYYLMYKSLAKQFSHSGVIVGILPANDFFENDYEIGKKIHSHRYRPYLVGDYPNYKLIYYNQDEWDQKGGLLAQSLRFIGGVLRGYTYSYNAITRLIDTQVVRRSLPDNKSYSGFYDFTEDQYQLIQYTLEKIIEEAKGKDVTLVTIPLLTDIKRYDQFGDSPLSQKLKAFSEKTSVRYIDLLPLMHDYSRDWGQYFLSCENHWGDYGNLAAFKILKSKLPNYTKSKAESKDITSK